MSYASFTPADMIVYPKPEMYVRPDNRYRGCPTVAVTKKGRVFVGWYTGGYCEPHMDNFNVLVMSDDGGRTFSPPVLVIPSNKEKLFHALDIQLWISPDGRLFVFWMQNDVWKTDLADCFEQTVLPNRGGYRFGDYNHNLWCVTCDDPDAETLVFSSPRKIDTGFLRCKPTVLPDGTWLLLNYDQLHDRYGYSISTDGLASMPQHCYGAKKYGGLFENGGEWFDEGMAYVMKNGNVRALFRDNHGKIVESISRDGARTFEDAHQTDITAPSSRHFVARTPSGRVLLVHNDHAKDRTNMTVKLSCDDGRTWQYSVCLDTRENLSYPDADFYGDKIYLVYDRERMGAREVIFACFSEEDIINGAAIGLKNIPQPE